ncbi:MAG TPA: methyltransferase domain-containing protein [Thermoleophilaceae bacterium]|nr:methyltransferase domain-containing protein [Thermoleophilaceae bacterium]
MQPPLTSAGETYQRLAPFYDELTREHDYDGWTHHLEQRALEFGVSGRRLFDAACGTGKSFIPFLERGYSVTGCDISSEMVALARAKAPAADLFVRDIRELDRVGSFDLITCIDDSLNYLIDDGDLEAAFAGLAANLAPDGVLLFDLNTLSTYRTTFGRDMTLDGPGVFLAWRGQCDEDEEPGCIAELIIEAFSETDDGRYRRVTTRHIQRHHQREEVESALAAAGLHAVGVFGLLPDGSLDTLADDHLHHKLVYYAQRVVKGGDTG